MKLKHSFLGWIVCLIISACGTQEKRPVLKPFLPRDLKEAIGYLTKDWDSTEKSRFKNLPERDAIAATHFTTGLWIRNNWVRGDRDTALVKYFNKLGIFSPDDISSIILTSFHRQLNNKELDLNGQVKPYIEYWKTISACEYRTKKTAVSNYNKFDLGNSITILMPVDTASNQRNAVMCQCPTVNWQFDPKKDLIIKGIITKKYFLNDSANVFFKVRINSMNFQNTRILMDSTKIGDIKDFSLQNLTIK